MHILTSLELVPFLPSMDRPLVGKYSLLINPPIIYISLDWRLHSLIQYRSAANLLTSASDSRDTPSYTRVLHTSECETREWLVKHTRMLICECEFSLSLAIELASTCTRTHKHSRSNSRVLALELTITCTRTCMYSQSNPLVLVLELAITNEGRVIWTYISSKLSLARAALQLLYLKNATVGCQHEMTCYYTSSEKIQCYRDQVVFKSSIYMQLVLTSYSRITELSNDNPLGALAIPW